MVGPPYRREGRDAPLKGGRRRCSLETSPAALPSLSALGLRNNFVTVGTGGSFPGLYGLAARPSRGCRRAPAERARAAREGAFGERHDRHRGGEREQPGEHVERRSGCRSPAPRTSSCTGTAAPARAPTRGASPATPRTCTTRPRRGAARAARRARWRARRARRAVPGADRPAGGDHVDEAAEHPRRRDRVAPEDDEGEHVASAAACCAAAGRRPRGATTASPAAPKVTMKWALS